jgi:hypothetical protein
MKRLVISIGILFGTASLACAQNVQLHDPSPSRRWLTNDQRSVVEIYWCKTSLCGKIVGLKPNRNSDGSYVLDTKNPDERLRSQPICGRDTLTNFVPSHWNPKRAIWIGRFYDPFQGKEDRVALTAYRPDEVILHMPRRGFLWPGRTLRWTLYTGQVTPDCKMMETDLQGSLRMRAQRSTGYERRMIDPSSRSGGEIE